MIKMRRNQQITSIRKSMWQSYSVGASRLMLGSSWAFWSTFSGTFGSCQYKKDPDERIWKSRSPPNGFCNGVLSACIRMKYKVHCGPKEVLTFSISNAQSKTYLVSTDSKHKDKNSILVFVQYIYENFLHIDDSYWNVQEVIWTDGPCSEFKKQVHHQDSLKVNREIQQTVFQEVFYNFAWKRHSGWSWW